MGQVFRRTLLGAAGATLTGAVLARKLAAQTILTPKPDAKVDLRGIDGLVETNPPVVPSAQSFADAEGHKLSLADFAGSGVVLNLWATWCMPCVAEMPALDAMAARLAAEGIVVVPLSSDRGGLKTVQRFYTAHDIAHLGIYLDAYGAAAEGWGARGLPTSLIIDRQGRERARLEGGADWTSDAAIAALRRLTAA